MHGPGAARPADGYTIANRRVAVGKTTVTLDSRAEFAR